MAYSQPTDLLLGEIPLPAYINSQKIVDDAADEIDSKLGYLYETPFNVDEAGPLSRPSRLLLKRVNNFLATGRLILMVASPEENQRLHAYGWSLIREANAAISSILSGEVVLDGATAIVQDTNPGAAPLIHNVDAESSVEAFYDRVANPYYQYVPLGIYRDPDRFVD